MRSWMIGMLAGASLAVSGAPHCQQPPVVPDTGVAHYKAGRETNVLGTVVAFTPNFKPAPFGARTDKPASSSQGAV